MRLKSLKISATIVLTGMLLLVFATGALAAPPWSDAPNSYWVNNYGVTDTEVATVADGYADNTFKPGLAVNRGQFAKMAVSGLDLLPIDRAAPTFLDVGKSNTFYEFVEGAYEEDLITGYPVTGGLEYRPLNNIQRQQANSILGRFLSDAEIAASGVIHGTGGLTYGSLALWYAAQGAFYLNGFDDGGTVATVHRPATAYLVYHGIVQGSNDKLSPLATLTRSQAAVMILRVAEEAAEITTGPPAPTNLSVMPTSPDNDTTPIVMGQTIPGGIVHIYDSVSGSPVDLFAGVSDAVAPRADASGTFTANLPTLTDGNHVFTAKVKNANGLVSPFSTSSAAYVLDTVPPTGATTSPEVQGEQIDAAVNAAKPTFAVAAEDERSGVGSVLFQVAADATTPDWNTVSTDVEPATGGIYEASWPSTGDLAEGLADGQYLFRATITDDAGNSATLEPTPVTVDTKAPTVAITLPLPNHEGVFYTENAKPPFSATAADPLPVAGDPSGMEKVDFLYFLITDGTTSPATLPTTWAGFTLLSTDTSPGYGATYDADGLDNGRYLLAVRATDRAGNSSLLMANATDYAAGVTQEVIIDDEPPVVTILEPDAGELVPEGTEFEIIWEVVDLTPPANVKIEYTEDATVQSPIWVEIVASTPDDGSYAWMVPAVAADNTTFRIRITATDAAGPIVGNVAGHTTVQMSGQFTVVADE